jgi:hypothetical protein
VRGAAVRSATYIDVAKLQQRDGIVAVALTQWLSLPSYQG